MVTVVLLLLDKKNVKFNFNIEFSIYIWFEKWKFSITNIFNPASVQFVAFVNEFIVTLSGLKQKLNTSV